MRNHIAVLALVTSTTIVLAHSGATGIVKKRMDGMGSLAQSMKALAQMAKSDEIDRVKIADIARDIQNQSGEAMTKRFPEKPQQMISEAAPLIWQDWEQFVRISDDLLQSANKLEMQAGANDLDLNSFIKEMGATCSSCHKDFRIKK